MEWEEAIQNADCSGYAHSEPVWDPVAKEIFCDCMPGYEWSQDNMHCVKISDTQTQTTSGFHQSNCNDQQEAGGDAPEVHNINLGTAFGSFVFDYDTYDVKDQIIVTQGGQTILNTGCVGESGSISLNLNGFSKTISVRVNPNCGGTSGTKWNFTVHCPRN